jgi:hypothetical protein
MCNNKVFAKYDRTADFDHDFIHINGNTGVVVFVVDYAVIVLFVINGDVVVIANDVGAVSIYTGM